jgi:diguanylate cyclase (GGDEF)-like protein/putative nucleotidyltransferase with HDIG domain
VHLPIARGTATLSMSYFTDFLALLSLGVDQGMLIAAASGATQCLLLARGKPSIWRTLFSSSALIISVQATALVIRAVGGFHDDATMLDMGRGLVCASATFFLANSWLVATAVAFSRRERVFKTWYADFLWTAPACIVGAALALLVTHPTSAFVWAPLVAAGPLLVTYKAYQIYLGRVEEQQLHLKEVSDLHLASVEALARAIDARDQTIDHARSGENHIRRVQAWAVALGEAAGMSANDLEALKIAALLHDIGKLAVPEHILTKPGRLTAKEFARVRIHPIIGAEIIKAVPFPYPVAPMIRSHHERWDGAGYPDGLRGDETPIGARILSIVDYFDGLSSTRPYHGPLSREDAIATLKAEAGKALDPNLVALFLTLLPAFERGGLVAGVPNTDAQAPPDAAPADGHPPGRRHSSPSWVFHNISLATQEMRALHEIAQTLGTRLSVDDTMALLASKLNRLIPGSCWVLYLHDRTEDVLRCRFASGLAADLIARLTIPGGEGPSGWAARQRSAVLNGRAATDFEAAGEPAGARPLQSALSYPLIDGDDLIGTLTVYHVDAEPYREEHRHVLDHISGQVASVLRNAVAFERMRDVSFTDPLTELPNSRALAEFLEQRVVTAPEPGCSALIMIDLDDFKAVNDGHGHQKGDAALHAVANAIRSHIRGSDFCARKGGDEFVVVLPNCDRAEAEVRARQLQSAVAAIRIDSPRGKSLPLGISVGVSIFPDDGTSVDALMGIADARMYIDKSARRSLGEIA